MADHISERGFRQAEPISGTYPNSRIRVYESSAAMRPCLWINVTDHNGTEAAAHLPIEDALEFAEDIIRLVRKHYQMREVEE